MPAFNPVSIRSASQPTKVYKKLPKSICKLSQKYVCYGYSFEGHSSNIMTNTIMTFTSNELTEILARGEDWSWVLNKSRAENCKYLVCCHHGGAKKGTAFLIGEISRIVDAPEDAGKDKPRANIQISKYAAIDIPNVWDGGRNPVRYTSLEELGINLTSLNFKDVIKESRDTVQTLSIEEAKLGISRKFGISPEQIEITIKG